MKFKAAILTEKNKPLLVDTISGGNRLNFGQVFVKILVSGICGAQLQEIRGEKGNTDFMPHLLGHEGAGVVAAIGPGVTKVKIGDKCVLHWRKGSGIEAACPFYGWKEVVGGGRVTTLSEYAIISENRLTPVPQDTRDDLCALLGCGLSSALGVIENEAKVRFGESVLIVGAGGLGVNLIRCACLAHAHPIVAVDIHENKRRLVCKLGATRYINSKTEKLEGGFDCIVDTAGVGDSMEATLPLLNSGGRFVMLGQPKPGNAVKMLNAHHMFQGEGKTIMATQGGGFMPTNDIPRYLALYKSGALKIDGIITKRIPLRKINDGIEAIKRGEAGRVLVDMSL